MPRMPSARQRGFGLAVSALTLTGCAHLVAPAPETTALCETDEVRITTGFVGAGHHGCAISTLGPVLTVWPEASIAGPINPSPWYAFEADIRSSKQIRLQLDYAGYWHRYHPWVSRDGGERWQQLPSEAVSVGEDDHIATLTLPAGPGHLLVAAQPVMTPKDMAKWSRTLASEYKLDLINYGESLDGRPLEALTAGPETARRIVFAITGQHPPEQAGVEAFKVFAETLMRTLPEDTRADTRIVLLPLVNPDGLARGNWRHNNGGVDTNRDWLDQSQPAIKAATAFIRNEAEGRTTVAFMDFHSTQETLVYTPPLEEDLADMNFPRALKQAFDAGIDPDPEWISGHNADSGTSKNWALQTLDVAALTVELADDAPQAEIVKVGEIAARTVISALTGSSGKED